MGGNRAVAEGLMKLAGDLGATLKPNSARRGRRDRETAPSRACGSAAGVVPYDRVISNMDAVRTYRELVGGEVGRAYEKRSCFEPACSGVVLYLGLNKRYDHLAHHDFVFSRAPRRKVRRDLPQGRAGAGPDRLSRGTQRHRPVGRARGRRGALRAGPHAVPPPAP